MRAAAWSVDSPGSDSPDDPKCLRATFHSRQQPALEPPLGLCPLTTEEREKGKEHGTIALKRMVAKRPPEELSIKPDGVASSGRYKRQKLGDGPSKVVYHPYLEVGMTA